MENNREIYEFSKLKRFLTMVNLKMEKWEEAEKDCDAALVIDPEFGKVSIRILY